MMVMAEAGVLASEEVLEEAVVIGEVAAIGVVAATGAAEEATGVVAVGMPLLLPRRRLRMPRLRLSVCR